MKNKEFAKRIIDNVCGYDAENLLGKSVHVELRLCLTQEQWGEMLGHITKKGAHFNEG